MESIVLVGAEDVSRAASSMRTTASEMGSAAATIDASIQRFERIVDRMEDAFRIFGDRMEYLFKDRLREVVALEAQKTGENTTPPRQTSVVLPVRGTSATLNDDPTREVVESIALSLAPKNLGGEVISRRAFYAEQAGRWRIRLAVDDREDPEMIFDVVDVDGPGLDGTGLDVERI